jgi:hypothetical protein
LYFTIDSGRCTTIASSSALATAADEEDLMVVVMEVGEEGNNNVEYEGITEACVVYYFAPWLWEQERATK